MPVLVPTPEREARAATAAHTLAAAEVLVKNLEAAEAQSRKTVESAERAVRTLKQQALREHLDMLVEQLKEMRHSEFELCRLIVLPNVIAAG